MPHQWEEVLLLFSGLLFLFPGRFLERSSQIWMLRGSAALWREAKSYCSRKPPFLPTPTSLELEQAYHARLVHAACSSLHCRTASSYGQGRGGEKDQLLILFPSHSLELTLSVTLKGP